MTGVYPAAWADPAALAAMLHAWEENDGNFDITQWAKEQRWPQGKPVCPHCGSNNIGDIQTRNIWKCYSCVRQFSLTSGTFLDHAKLDIDTALLMLAFICRGDRIDEMADCMGINHNTLRLLARRAGMTIRKHRALRDGATG